MTYKIRVHYRYVVNGEQENDFEYFEVEAESEEQAAIFALKNFDRLSVIPYKTEIL